jgi:Reverse transcriptase (RNA-dependent DNA polymerase)
LVLKKEQLAMMLLIFFHQTAQYNTENGSYVSVPAVDMSNAFDKVNHHDLFIKLMQRGVPVCPIKLLMDWYGNSYTCVKWNNIFSSCIHLSYGVHQGGVLSIGVN